MGRILAVRSNQVKENTVVHKVVLGIIVQGQRRGTEIESIGLGDALDLLVRACQAEQLWMEFWVQMSDPIAYQKETKTNTFDILGNGLDRVSFGIAADEDGHHGLLARKGLVCCCADTLVRS